MININRGSASLGVFSDEDVRAGLSTGRFATTDLGWREGMTSWQTLAQFPEFAEAMEPSVPMVGPAVPGTAITSSHTGYTSRARTGGMTTIAILNFIFGGAGILMCLFSLIMASALMFNPAFGGKGVQVGILTLIISLLSLPSAAAAIVAGVGILKVASWARTWSLIYAIIAILVTLISLPLSSTLHGLSPNSHQSGNPFLSAVIGCIYPAIVLYLINTQKWKATFNLKVGSVA